MSRGDLITQYIPGPRDLDLARETGGYPLGALDLP